MSAVLKQCYILLSADVLVLSADVLVLSADVLVLSENHSSVLGLSNLFADILS